MRDRRFAAALAVILMALVTIFSLSTPRPARAQSLPPSSNGNWAWGFHSAYVPFGRGDTRGSLNQDAGFSWNNTTKTLTATHISGAIDGDVIGGTTPAAGNFTTLGASGTMSATLNDSTALQATGTPINTATISLVQIGGAIAGGNAAANGGTYLGGNAPAAGHGLDADWIDFQANGTPVLLVDHAGNVTAGKYNKVTVTAPATGSTLTIADGKTLTVSNSLTLAGSDGDTLTVPTGGGTAALRGATNTFSNIQTFTNLAGPSLVVGGVQAGAVNLGDGAVTQATNVNTDVTDNAASGVIRTASASTGAATVETGFTLHDSAIAATSVVVYSISDYSGTYFTNGVPQVLEDSVAAGSVHFRIANMNATNALSGTLKIHFVVE